MTLFEFAKKAGDLYPMGYVSVDITLHSMDGKVSEEAEYATYVGDLKIRTCEPTPELALERLAVAVNNAFGKVRPSPDMELSKDGIEEIS